MISKCKSRRKGINVKDRGSRIITAMRKAKLSRDKCSSKTGISQGVITKIRAGEDCWLSEFIILAKVLNVSLDRLAGVEKTQLQKKDDEQLSLIQSLPVDIRDDVFQLVERISKRDF